MTTIKSVSTYASLLTEPAEADGDLYLELTVRGACASGVFKRADLLAALDAPANADVQEVGIWKARAERAEAELKAAREHYGAALSAVSANRDQNAKMLRQTVIDWDAARARAEDAEAFGAAAVKRAEEAEAALTEIRDLVAARRGTGPTFHAIRDIAAEVLDPKPVFTLPTEVPAAIMARPDWIPDDEDGTVTLHLWTDGEDLCWSTEDGDTGYTPDQVMVQFTHHRLVEQ